MSAHVSQHASTRETRNRARTFSIPCSCSGGCVLCDAHGMRPLDRLDVVRLRRTALNRGFRSVVLMAERALADEDDAVAWYACAEALR